MNGRVHFEMGVRALANKTQWHNRYPVRKKKNVAMTSSDFFGTNALPYMGIRTQITRAPRDTLPGQRRGKLEI
jgi:hypothetical protein